MILIGLGANVAGPWGPPRETVMRALAALDRMPCRLEHVSRLLITAPFGKPNQPPFVNAVARIVTHLPPQALMRHLHAIERSAGRRRGIAWGPRTLDLDLLDYHGLIRGHPRAGGRRPLLLPHPGIAERVFVLAPIAEIAPRWRHPVLRQGAAVLLRRLAGVRPGAEL
jgi:2-amino-4-hydroxy-6-hydroxymethyldihydropteridine diphosphokinase